MIVWSGCYDESWKGLIVHPAKFSRGLIRRIYQHLRDEYHLPRGGIVRVDQNLLNHIRSEIDSGRYQRIE
jgi:predicted small metal-binding protein